MIHKFSWPDVTLAPGGVQPLVVVTRTVRRWLHVGTQRGVLCAWAEVVDDTSVDPRKRHMLAVGTGFGPGTLADRVHIGTAVDVGPFELVVHLIDEEVPF
jgi:hypothetical protein